MKKTLNKKTGFKQPKTLIETITVAAVEVALAGAMVVVISSVLYWAFNNDQTNVEAQKVWTEQAIEMDQRLEAEALERAHASKGVRLEF